MAQKKVEIIIFATKNWENIADLIVGFISIESTSTKFIPKETKIQK